MATLVIVLRLVPLVVFAGPLLLSMATRSRGPWTPARHGGGGRAPFATNVAAFGMYCFSILMWSGGAGDSGAHVLASAGALVGVAGALLIHRSRTELGAAWSLVPRADRGIGLVSTGPYRVVRHPIYLGFLLLAIGEALAFGSWPALLIVLCGMVPTFVWRARAEEALLSRIFSDKYAIYTRRTWMLVPYLF